jgi:hypothetical protein
MSEPLPTVVGPYKPTLEKNLLQSLSFSPLPTGGANNGWCVIHINGLDSIPAGARFVITFEDVFGKQTRLEHVWIPNQ